MLFVPLPLFATLFLAGLCWRIVLTRDMTQRAHQLFAGLVALYAVQSLVVSLRWGYGIEGLSALMVLLAPVLPALAYMAYAALTDQGPWRRFWPLAAVGLNWLAFAVLPGLPDPVIVMTYLGFGGVLLHLWWKGADALAQSSINDARDIRWAMGLTGMALVASGLTDVLVIIDFMRNGGDNAATILTFAQTAFVVVIGGAASFGRAAPAPGADPAPVPLPPEATDHDAEILRRLEHLFEEHGLHRSEDLSLRRLSRRLGLPDRQVSNAINRVRNTSVSQFVNDFRIRDACALLQSTDKTVLDVSLEVGFATKSNFNRAFLSVTGETPTGWRNAHRQSAGDVPGGAGPGAAGI